MHKDVLMTTAGTGTWATLVASFGLTWWAIAMAFFGVALSLYFAGEKTPTNAKSLVMFIMVMGTLSAAIAGSLPSMWEITSNIPVEPRAFFVGVCCNLIPLGYEWAKRYLSRKGAPE